MTDTLPSIPVIPEADSKPPTTPTGKAAPETPPTAALLSTENNLTDPVHPIDASVLEAFPVIADKVAEIALDPPTETPGPEPSEANIDGSVPEVVETAAAEPNEQPAEDVVPTADVDAPTAEVDAPTAEVDAPTAEDVVPTADVDAPTADDVVPTAEDAAPTAEEAAAPVVDTTVVANVVDAVEEVKETNNNEEGAEESRGSAAADGECVPPEPNTAVDRITVQAAVTSLLSPGGASMISPSVIVDGEPTLGWDIDSTRNNIDMTQTNIDLTQNSLLDGAPAEPSRIEDNAVGDIVLTSTIPDATGEIVLTSTIPDATGEIVLTSTIPDAPDVPEYFPAVSLSIPEESIPNSPLPSVPDPQSVLLQLVHSERRVADLHLRLERTMADLNGQLGWSRMETAAATERADDAEKRARESTERAAIAEARAAALQKLVREAEGDRILSNAVPSGAQRYASNGMNVRMYVSKTTTEILEFAVDQAAEALNWNGPPVEKLDYLQRKLEEKCGGNWGCILMEIDSQPPLAWNVKHRRHHMYFRVSRWTFVLWDQ